ncbi:MAG: GatB/YqeY domain-containing protein [Thermoanaerobaculia bacterium]|nr:GatB/YqeY domain-containing protein [Thermoanaerobaculia bacterium]
MSLTEQVRADMTAAMKAKEAERLSTLRMLQSALKNEQIEKMHELSDAEASAVIRRGVKQRQDSIEQFEKAGRQELADKEKRELAILETYLPKQMSDAALEEIIEAIIAATGAASKKDTGKVMKEIMAKHRDEVDGKKVQEILGRLLP